MEDYQIVERRNLLLEERDLLNTKIVALDEFIENQFGKDDHYEEVSPGELNRLSEQLRCMEKYVAILNSRIIRFK